MSSIDTITPLATPALPAVPPYAGTPAVPGATPASTPGSDAAVSLTLSPSSRLQSDRDAALALGSRARAADAAFEQAIGLVKDMKTQLSSITKQFPPFASDDQERIRYLNTFSGLRKQVEALTIPPEPAATGAWSQVRFPDQPLGQGMPELDPANASDEDIARAETQLERIGADLARQRESLYDSVMAALGGGSGADQARALSQEIRSTLAS